MGSSSGLELHVWLANELQLFHILISSVMQYLLILQMHAIA